MRLATSFRTPKAAAQALAAYATPQLVCRPPSWSGLSRKLRARALSLTLFAVTLALLASVVSVRASAQTAPQIPFGAPHGELRIIMVYVQYSDSSPSADPEALFRAQASMIESWYREVSYGMTTYRVDGLQRWIRIDKLAATYGLNQYQRPTNARQAFIQDVVTAVDPFVDFRQYRALAIVHPNNTPISCCWSMGRRWGAAPPAYMMSLPTQDGVAVERAAIVNEQSRFSLNHEIGHTMGLPDLYSHDIAAARGGRSDVFIGTWDIMSTWPRGARYGPHFLSWMKWLLGWIPESRVRTVQPGETATVVIDPLALPSTGIHAVRIPLGNGRFYFIENRQRIGADRDLPKAGILITLVDETIANGKGPVRVVNARPEAQDPATRDQYGPFYAAPFDIGPGEVSTFIDHTGGVRVIVEAREGQSYRITVSTP